MPAYTLFFLSLLFLAQLNAKAEVDARCQAIKNKKFVSIDLLVGGATPEGTTKSHWTISFTEKEYYWMHTDLGETGTYECKKGAISAGNLNGKYDVQKKELLWNGVKYR